MPQKHAWSRAVGVLHMKPHAQHVQEEGSPSYMRLKAELVKRFGPETFAGQKAAVQQLLTDAV